MSRRPRYPGQAADVFMLGVGIGICVQIVGLVILGVWLGR